jgi:ParB-like chromosome segregation protein Spo0J
MKSALLGIDYEIHPFALRMPEMSDTDFNLLKESIQRDGLLNPIVLFKGKILDGRHRYRACRELQIVAQFVKYRGSTPATFVFGNNVPRRQLSVSDKLRLVELFLPDIQAEAQRRQTAGTLASADAKGKTSEIVAKLIGVSPATVDRDRAIKRAIQRLEAAGRDDAAWKVQEAAAKSVRLGAAAAKAAEMMLDAEPELLSRLRNILSPEEIHAIEIGTVPLSTSDLRLWVAIDPEEARQINYLVFGHHWTVKNAVKFIRDEIDESTTIGELKNRCLAARGKFEITLNAFRITLVYLNQNKRQK